MNLLEVKKLLCYSLAYDFMSSHSEPYQITGNYQFSSVAQSCPTICDPMDCRTPSFPIHHQLLELTQTHVYLVSDAIQPSHPLLSTSSPSSIFSNIRVFPNDSLLHIRWPKYWSFTGELMLSNWCWRGLLRVTWTAKRSNPSILKTNPEYSLEGLMLKLKLQYFGHLMRRADSLEKTLMLGKIEGRRRRGRQRVRWLDGITDSMDMSLS